MVMEPVHRAGLVGKAPVWLIAAALLALGPTACGEGVTRTNSSSDAFRATTTESASSRDFRPLHAIGDYDTDDYQTGGDADDDDSTGRLDHDGDSDNPSGSAYDGDDTTMVNYGRAASTAETRAVAALVRRFLTAAAASDGAKGCSMILASVARTIPTVLAGVGGAPYARGHTCAEVVSKIFRFYRKQLTVEAHSLQVARFGVQGNSGLAVLNSKAIPTFPERVIALRRQGRAWKINGVLDNELP